MGSAGPIERNVGKNYLFVFLSSTSLSEAIWVLYLGFRGMSLLQIGFIEAVFHLTSMLMEVPTGIVADRFGRKASRIAGRAMAMLATLLMVSSRSFWGFVLAFVFTALSYNLESGAGDALVYDSLLQCGKQEGYIKVKGRQEVIFHAAQIVSLVASGIVATFDYTLAYLLTLGIHGASFAVALTFEEPVIGRAVEGGPKRGLGSHITESFRVLRDNRGILVYVLFLEGFGVFYTTLHFYFQSYLKSRGSVEWQIGLVLALSALAGMVGGGGAHVLERKLGERRLVSLVPFVALTAFALIALTGLEIPGMVLLAGVEGLLYVVFSASINRLIPSQYRATLLSFEAMAFSVMMIVLFPLVGAVAEASRLKVAFIVVFAASVPVLLVSRGLLLGRVPRRPA